jgi:energy-coupling factor transporter transmembrane protein EcfT
MAMALEARGFGSSKKRTFYIQLKMHPHDWIALVVTAVLSFASLWFAT